MTSTSILSMAWLLQRVDSVSLTGLQCSALQAVQDGFCAALSTIPAFLEQAEIMHEGKRPLYSWLYIVVFQYCGAYMLCTLIIGPVWWTRGLVTQCSFL
jgi:fluoride ion exporter CrcB/FEX